MTPAEWDQHAVKCREVAQTIEDKTARQILLEAAEDYSAMALRESVIAVLDISAYQVAPASKQGRSISQ